MAGPPHDGRVDPDRAADRARDEALVLALRDGDQDAFGQLYDHWYDRVHDLARRVTRDDGLADDVAQDAFLTAWQRLDRLDDPASFGGWLLRIARNRALDVVRAPVRARTEAVAEMTDDAAARGVTAGDRLAGFGDPAEIAGDQEVQEMVWEAAGALGERDLTALDLHLRHGLDPAEIGEVLGINRNAANQLVHRMRGRLSSAVSCQVLWRGGRPRCAALSGELVAAGVRDFDAETVRVTNRHAKGCPDCTRHRATRLDPAKLFAAMPIAVAGLAAKQEAAAALAAQGVPMGGSQALATTSTTASAGPEGFDSTDSIDRTSHKDPTDPADETDATDPMESGGGGQEGAGRERSRRAAYAAAVLVVLVLALVLGVGALGDGGVTEDDVAADSPREAVRSPATTTDTGGMTLTVSPDAGLDPATGDAPPAASGGTGPGEDPPGPGPAPAGDAPAVVTVPPAPPPPPPARPQGSISAAPSRVPTVHPNGQPVISWSSAGGTTVSVSGPGLSSAAASGSQPVCPGTVVSGVCRAPAGTYTYTLDVSGPGGSIQRSTTLTVA